MRQHDGISDVIKAVEPHSHHPQVIGGEVLGGSTAALLELAAIAAEIDAGNQHTHTNPPEQLLAGGLSLPLCGQPIVHQFQHEIQLLWWHHEGECIQQQHVRKV